MKKKEKFTPKLELKKFIIAKLTNLRSIKGGNQEGDDSNTLHTLRDSDRCK